MSERHTPEDTLRARYAEASAREDARPSVHVRDAVLAHARAVAQRAGHTPAVRKPANDAVWGWRAVATIAVIGFTALIGRHYIESPPDFDERVASMPSAPASPEAAGVAVRAPAEVEVFKGDVTVAEVTDSGRGSAVALPELQKSKVAAAGAHKPAVRNMPPAAPSATPSRGDVAQRIAIEPEQKLTDKKTASVDAAAVPPKPAELLERAPSPAVAAPPLPELRAAAPASPMAPAAAPAVVPPPSPAARAVAPQKPAAVQDRAADYTSAAPAQGGAAGRSQATLPEPPKPSAKIAAEASASADVAAARAPSPAVGGLVRPQAGLAESGPPMLAQAPRADAAGERRRESASANVAANAASAAGAVGAVSGQTDGSALIAAARSGNVAALTAALGSGASPNLRDADGTTVLSLAVRAGCEPCVARLLRAGADANARDRQGITPMAHARLAGNAAIVELLVEAGGR
jgi:general secretion pathway protein B